MNGSAALETFAGALGKAKSNSFTAEGYSEVVTGISNDGIL